VPEGGAQVPYFSQAKDPAQQSAFNNPILPDIQKSKGNASAVYFRVQLAAFNEQQSEEKLKELFEYSPFAFFIEEGGMYKYMVGEYKSYREALKAQMHLRGYGFSGAFVSAWIGTRKLTASEMQQHIK
jgi:SPOR domain